MLKRIDDAIPPLTITRRFAAPPALLFDAWLDPKAVGRWLFRTPTGQSAHVEIDARVGGGFAIHEQRGEILATHFGEYVEIERPSRLVFTLGLQRECSSTRIAIDIRPDGVGSLLTLTHHMTTEAAAKSFAIRAGWAGILEGLARETGEADAPHRLILLRKFAAPRALVFKCLTEPQHMMRWLCPARFQVLFAENDLRIGGKWRSGMRSPEGDDFIHHGEYLEIDAPARLVMTHQWERNHLEPKALTTLEMELVEQNGETEMTFVQSGLATAESAASHSNGWTGAFDYLAELARELATSDH
ncbi:SRPBCC family protein [Methylosinus sporium]|uniref:SRPBCC domain-containing protein n=1 Tax=Methylosinus sporium TaxID=428 RepID=A0A2U1SV25_METSR|nr:SRPBCC family protein [Methylosinus sporium]PWB95474.1 SRPBCC domain-containing protein [Methylosinus sporium]